MGLFNFGRKKKFYNQFVEGRKRTLADKAADGILDILQYYSTGDKVDDFSFVVSWYMDFMSQLTQLKPDFLKI